MVLSLLDVQVEGENSRINGLIQRNVGVDILHRILTVHAVKVNIRQGVACGRIPESMRNINIIRLLRCSLLHTQGVTFSENEEWIREICHIKHGGIIT